MNLTLMDVVEFKNKLEEVGIEIPKGTVFPIEDFKKEIPKNLHRHIEVDAYGCSVIDEKWYQRCIRKELDKNI